VNPWGLVAVGGAVLAGAALLPSTAQAGVPRRPVPQPWRMSASARAKLRQREGAIDRLYNDPKGHCTIGVGHLVHLGNCNAEVIRAKAGAEADAFMAGGLPPAGDNTRAPGRALNDAEIDALFARDLRTFERWVERKVTVPLSQNQIDALVSYTFNAGFRRPGEAVEALNRGDYVEAARRIENGPTAGLASVARRRREEAELFLKA